MFILLSNMCHTIKISVIIPTYKPEKYLLECLDSILKQTLDYKSYEVIVVLNGICEPYYSLISPYTKHENVKILYDEMANVSNARNRGLEIANGEYVCFVDDDDVVSSNYLEGLLKISTSEIVGVSNVRSFKHLISDWGENFFACKVVQRQKYCNSLFRNRALLSFPVAKLIHHSIIANRLFDLRFKNGEDALFMTQISDRIKGFAFTDKSACYYVRERNGSASRKYIGWRKVVKDSFRLISTYISTYLSSPCKYDFLLFASRIPAVIKGGIILLRNRNITS